MKITNPWVGYATRSYLDIKNSLLSRLGMKVPELTDHSESNPLVIGISMFSGVAETINYYIDNMARETFISTARKYSSVVKHTRLIDYRIKSAIPASADLTIRFFDENDNPVQAGINFIIPMGTMFSSTQDGLQFISISDIEVDASALQAIVPTQQKTFVEIYSLGEATGLSDSTYILPDDYVHNSIQLKVNDTYWELVNTLGTSRPNSEHFIVDVSTNRQPYVKFGDNSYGKLPQTGSLLTASYFTTSGLSGNVEANTITEGTINIPLGANFNKVVINNNNPATGGSNYEDIETIRRRAPLHLRTLDRAVTRRDYEDIAMLAPGVDKALVRHDCGKEIICYITPTGGGIAQEALLSSTYNWISERKMVTTFVDVNPAGESYIKIKLTVHARFRKDPLITKQEVVNALTTTYNYQNSHINNKIRLSDIYAVVDNLESVDYLDIENLYVVPYFRPLESAQQITPDITINEGSQNIVQWVIEYQDGRLLLIKYGLFITTFETGTPYTDDNNIFTILVPQGNYNDGDRWEFTTYPRERNIEINDYSVPIIRAQDIDITVHETLSN